MSRTLKWVLVVALVLAATLLAYTRISDALDEFMQQQDQPGLQENQPSAQPPQPRVDPHDPLIRT